MKAKHLTWTLLSLLLGVGACQPSAQQTKADHKSLDEIKATAEKGDARAQNELGDVFYDGKVGVATNYVEAVKWYGKAAEQGSAKAQRRLAMAYAKGEGVPKDMDAALQWFRKAAQQGDARAQNELGDVFYDGKFGVRTNYLEAVEWYRKAAEQGDAEGQYNLGYCYDKGKGVTQDTGEGGKWYGKAAEQGFAKAQRRLAMAYAKGEGVPKDMDAALQWFRKAAQQGEVDAQFNLGTCYENGKGVTQDTAEAMKWYRKASAQGHDEAKRRLSSIAFGNLAEFLEYKARHAATNAHTPSEVAAQVARARVELLSFFTRLATNVQANGQSSTPELKASSREPDGSYREERLLLLDCDENGAWRIITAGLGYSPVWDNLLGGLMTVSVTEQLYKASELLNVTVGQIGPSGLLPRTDTKRGYCLDVEPAKGASCVTRGVALTFKTKTDFEDAFRKCLEAFKEDPKPANTNYFGEDSFFQFAAGSRENAERLATLLYNYCVLFGAPERMPADGIPLDQLEKFIREKKK